jgi:hypothetical protein
MANKMTYLIVGGALVAATIFAGGMFIPTKAPDANLSVRPAPSAIVATPPGRREYGPGTPPIWRNSIASTNWDLIRANDPDALTGVTFVGVISKEMPRSLSNRSAHQEQAYVFRATFRDSRPIDILMSEDYGSEAAARADVDKYAPRLGKLPSFYRNNLRYIVGHVGDSNLTSEDKGHFFVIFSERAAKRIANNDLEESFFHEATHAAVQKEAGGLGKNLLSSPRWRAAVEADRAYITAYAATSPQEDFAESALFGYAMTFYPERFSDTDRTAIQAQIPHRLAFWREVFTNDMK